MSYSFATHLSFLVGSQVEACSMEARRQGRTFALIDAGQMTDPEKNQLHRLARHARSLLLFQGSFAESAQALSPVLIELSDQPESLGQEILSLDGACHELPILSILRSALTLDALGEHLRSLLRVEADGDEFLLRLADTQMLSAANAALTPTQRERVFAGVESWWIVDHCGDLHDLAVGGRAQPPAAVPLCLDMRQTHALLEAASVPMLASQLRALDPRFSETLTHAQQIGFANGSVMAAREAGIADDAELTAWTLQRWEAAHGVTE